MTTPQLLELYRGRWLRAREAMSLADPTSAGFGTGGLARHAPDAHVRFLVLPGDPEGTRFQLVRTRPGRVEQRDLVRQRDGLIAVDVLKGRQYVGTGQVTAA